MNRPADGTGTPPHPIVPEMAMPAPAMPAPAMPATADFADIPDAAPSDAAPSSAAPSSAVPSSAVPDWAREAPRGLWDPSRRLLRTIRRYQAAQAKASPEARIAQKWRARVVRKWWALQHLFWSTVTQAEIPLTARIGGGLLLPHPNGIVIHPEAVIGPNCLIFHQVTIGIRAGAPGLAVIGGHVDIGAGAKILGPVRIGDHAAIGANAVVLGDVPAGAVAVGVPARLVERTGRGDGPRG